MSPDEIRRINDAVGFRPVRWFVAGSPFQPGDRVTVTRATDRDVYDVTRYVGCSGVVDYLEYECGCGQHFPEEPMVGVKFEDGTVEAFWPGELSAR